MDDGGAFLYGTSLRAVPVEITLQRAARLAGTLGITRVTDVTRLDRIGIPVFVSIRPGAHKESVCVNAGKGLTAQDACAGAWMEAIEYAMAEPGASSVGSVSVPACRVLDGRVDPPAILDLCPRLGASIPLREEIPCVAAEDLLSGQPCFVPAELVFLPAPAECQCWYFGHTANGLASGNTILEATVHGLAEVVERDIRAFHLVQDRSALVLEETFPPPAAALAEAIRAAGLQLFVRYEANAFQLPFFLATIADPDNASPLGVHGGSGCHPHRTIALVRAICEAAQSRLSFIHGGRDDLVDWYNQLQEWDEARKTDHRQALLDKASDAAKVVRFEEIADCAEQTETLDACFNMLVSALSRAGIEQICRVVFTHRQAELQVVKMIVPLLEEFDVFSCRVGRRLRDHVES